MKAEELVVWQTFRWMGDSWIWQRLDGKEMEVEGLKAVPVRSVMPTMGRSGYIPSNDEVELIDVPSVVRLM